MMYERMVKVEVKMGSMDAAVDARARLGWVWSVMGVSKVYERLIWHAQSSV